MIAGITIGVGLVIAVIIFLMKSNDGHSTIVASPRTHEASPRTAKEKLFSPTYTVRQMADNIKSKGDHEALEREMAKIEHRMQNVSEKTYDRLVDYSNALQEVESIAQCKTIGWQLTVAESIDVPLGIIRHAFKVYAPGDRTIDRHALAQDGLSWWLPLDPYSEVEKEPKWLPALIAFRQIVEGQAPISQKIDAINELDAKEEKALHEIFAPCKPLTAGQEWVARKLDEQGLPFARELVAEGVMSAADVLKIDAASFDKRKGVGPAKLKQFIQFQERARGGGLVKPNL